MIGQGHGAAFLRERASKLIAAGAPLVAIDPDAANLRARRAYAKAGFVETRVAPTPAGDVAVMVFKTSPRSKSPVGDFDRKIRMSATADMRAGRGRAKRG